jgi:hypothetical protein
LHHRNNELSEFEIWDSNLVIPQPRPKEEMATMKRILGNQDLKSEDRMGSRAVECFSKVHRDGTKNN